MDAAGRGDMPEQSWRALLGYMKQVNPTLWQLFGGLSDAQIDSFLATRRIAIPVRTLTPGQRRALDAVLDANKGREIEMSGVTLPDFRTLLYKMGAKENLSNVTIGFTVEGANTLSFSARVQGVKDPLVWTGWAQVPRLGPKASAVRPASNRTGAQSQTPLPEWAPKNPSPEFLRAARVLKPYPVEPTQPGSEGAPGLAALSIRIRATWPAAWEFFGTLTDKQVRHFSTTREIRIPVKSLTTTQRTALDKWFEAYRKAMKGAMQELPVPDDYLVRLYKEGADRDLSSVDVGFATVPEGTSSTAIVSTHRVQIWFWVRQREGGVTQFGYGIAQI